MPVPETLFTSLTFFLQDTTTARSRLFKQLVLQHRSLQTSLEAQGEEMKKKEEGHKAEMTRVKEELDRVLKLKAQLKKDRDKLQLEKASV